MCERKQLRYHQALGCLLLWFLFRFTWVEPCHFNTYQTHVALTAHLDIIVWRKTNLMHNLFWVYFVTLYMFRAYLGQLSWGTTVRIQHLVLIIHLRWLSVVLVGVYIRLHVLMMGLDTSETCRGWRNILRKIWCFSDRAS